MSDHIQFYKGSYRVRIGVPADVRPFIVHRGKHAPRELTERLGTSNKCEAKRLAPAILAKFLTQIETARKGETFHISSETPHLVDIVSSFGKRVTTDAPRVALEPVTFESILGSWELENEKPSARRDMRRNIAKFAAFVGHDDASRVAPQNIIAWKESMLATAMAKKSVQLHVGSVKTLFKFAAANHKLGSDPASGITYRAPKGSQKIPSIAYTVDQARRIVIEANSQPAEIRWPILIASFIGARISEIVDAYKADVEAIEGIWCLQVREDNREEGQDVKTEGSVRTVPLHSELIRQGFLSFVQSLPDGSPLFRQFKPGRDNRRAENSRPINNFIRKDLGMTDKRKKPKHAWRHFVAGQLRDLGIRLDVAEGITGHGSARRSELWAYGEYVRAMSAAIEKLPNPLA
jgi:integrase